MRPPGDRFLFLGAESEVRFCTGIGLGLLSFVIFFFFFLVLRQMITAAPHLRTAGSETIKNKKAKRKPNTPNSLPEF